MGLFKRSRSKDDDTPPGVDSELTFFTPAEAGRFRAVVGEAFATAGLEVVVHPGHAVDADGREFGLWNIAAYCRDLDPEMWPLEVAEHVARVLGSMAAPSGFVDLEHDEAHFRAYTRLYDPASVLRLDDYPHQEFAPGLVEMIALDLPEAVELFDAEQVGRFGGFEALRTSGIANLRDLPGDEVDTIERDGVRLQVLNDGSVYTASRALLMPQLAEQLTGEQPGEHGWLLSVPSRHHVVWHFVRDRTVIDAVNLLTHVTLRLYSDSPGQLSPHVYWWDGTGYERLTSIDAEAGRVQIAPSPRFQAVVEALVGE